MRQAPGQSEYRNLPVHGGEKMKFSVTVFPGSNCDHDCEYVVRDVMGQKVEMIWHKDTDLKDPDCVIVPGGFSYGDYLRTGAIARFSPVIDRKSTRLNS